MRRTRDLIVADPKSTELRGTHELEVDELRRKLVAWGLTRNLPIDPEYDPRLELAKLAHDITVPMPLRIECHKIASEYMFPKIRNMELNVDGDGLTIRVVRFTPSETTA